MGSDEKSDYQVGYGRPPQHTQFKPGESGNPRGRPRGAKNFFVLLEEELKQRVIINENGRRRKISKRAAIVKHMVNKTLSGDPRLLQILLNELRAREVRGDSVQASFNLDEGDRDVIRQLQERLTAMAKEGSINGSGN
jgi:hypothetical protein